MEQAIFYKYIVKSLSIEMLPTLKRDKILTETGAPLGNQSNLPLVLATTCCHSFSFQT